MDKSTAVMNRYFYLRSWHSYGWCFTCSGPLSRTVHPATPQKVLWYNLRNLTKSSNCHHGIQISPDLNKFKHSWDMQEQVLYMEALLCIRFGSSLAWTWEPLRVSCCIWHHLGGNPLSSVVCEAGPPWISTSHRCLIGLGSGESKGHMDTFSSSCFCAVFVVLRGALSHCGCRQGVPVP